MKALQYEEKLLWEKERSDTPGVDLPKPKFSPLRTGFQAREAIGLPQLSEPEVIRHFVRMSTWNYSIDHGLFPLGSCTMKHNPRLNEKLARLAGFSQIHPLQPQESVQGALALMYELRSILSDLTGLPGVALSPAAGAHGELAGLMTIRCAHVAKGEGEKRRVMLIPDSAHGTNPATAAMCGYQVRVIPTTETGRLTLAAFEAALGDGSDVAGMMVTNPNTCGLFETEICEISDLLHKAGGYFYCDGANFNALVGRIKPVDFGVDVLHLNLHKTFSTPHGGGGPGSGPICVSGALEPFLPAPIVVKEGANFRLLDCSDRPATCGRLKGFHGQFGMHVRALAYILSHGIDGLRAVSDKAVLNANYILAKLRNDYFVPFNGYCMHECLLTDRLQKENDVQTIDIAKALIEYSFHPMTVYFPAIRPGTMLIEPTETETKQSLDRFIEAMKAIALAAKDPEKRQALHEMPLSSPRRRIDEVKAAKFPVLRYWARLPNPNVFKNSIN